MTIERLKSQGINLPSLAPDLCCPFDTAQLARSRVIWINKRWFTDALEQSQSVIDWGLISSWLLDEFAFCVPSPRDSTLSFTSIRKPFFADRYGDDALTPHGGSGRVGASGCFQVKGIGPTPLVGKDADWLHNHGCMWLEEGIREALLGELLHRCSPVGVVPVIALIDTGIDSDFTLDSPDRRRVLAVRPCFLRPAHLQRAPMFSPLRGDRLHAQFVDARRTRQMVRLHCHQESLIKFVDASSAQAAYAYVHRIYLGGMLGSNWSLDGRLVDFGGVTGVANWQPKEIVCGLPAFGSETVALEQSLEAISVRMLELLGDDGRTTPADVRARFRRGIASWLTRLADAYGLPGNSFLVASNGAISSCAAPVSAPRFQFERQQMQRLLWEQTSYPNALSLEHIESLIEHWLEQLTMP